MNAYQAFARKLSIIELTDAIEEPTPEQYAAERGAVEALRRARTAIEFKVALCFHVGTPEAIAKARGLRSALVEIELLEHHIVSIGLQVGE